MGGNSTRRGFRAMAGFLYPHTGSNIPPSPWLRTGRPSFVLSRVEGLRMGRRDFRARKRHSHIPQNVGTFSREW